MTPKEYLNQPKVLRDLIREQETDLKMLEAEADGMTGISFDKEPVKVSLVQSGTEEYIVKIEQLRQAIEANKHKFNIVYADVERTIDKLGNEREKQVLKLRYLMFLEWKVIFSQMNETQDVVYSLHKRALNHIRC